LAEQHFETFKRRFAPYPFRLGLFSRFVDAAGIRRGLAELAAGSLDVAIGTHRLFSQDVRFKNLGLLVVDEEHRFGVAAKERLRFLAAGVHTLYLSATPIPRTLAGALSGYKKISLIQSPPVGRLPVETHVGPWDQEVILRALRYEMSRAGQAFYVANEIKRLPEIAREMERLIPGLRAGACHGQMRASQIEEVMHRFLAKDFDLLVASSIVESGLDIPSVNTLFVEEAQDFGLSDLYQLRGRIGRSSARAFAYFFCPSDEELKTLPEKVRERLSSLREFAALGSGLRLALRDLELRGAGEVLGVRQHGFVSRVGIELYSKMLASEMERMSSEAPGAVPARGIFPKVHFQTPAYLPAHYLPAAAERVS
jgi:transcription-repair coupling factor (superfamily II helicase)